MALRRQPPGVQQGASTPNYNELLAELFKDHDPERLPHLPVILNQENDAEAIYRFYCKKYRVEPFANVGGGRAPEPLLAGAGQEAAGDSNSDLRRLFNRCDLNGDGHITRKEIIKAAVDDSEIARSLGIPARVYRSPDARAELERWFDGINMDKNRRLSWPEFHTWLQHHARIENELQQDEDEDEKPIDPNRYKNLRMSHRSSIEAELEKRLGLSSAGDESPHRGGAPEDERDEVNGKLEGEPLQAESAPDQLKAATPRRSVADMIGEDSDFDGDIKVQSRENSERLGSSLSYKGSLKLHQSNLLQQLGSMDALLKQLASGEPPPESPAESLEGIKQSFDFAAPESSQKVLHEEQRYDPPSGYSYTLEEFYGANKAWKNPADDPETVVFGSTKEPEPDQEPDHNQASCNGRCDAALEWQSAYTGVNARYQALVKAVMDLGQRTLEAIRGTNDLSGQQLLELLVATIGPCTGVVSELGLLWAQLDQELKPGKASSSSIGTKVKANPIISDKKAKPQSMPWAGAPTSPVGPLGTLEPPEPPPQLFGSSPANGGVGGRAPPPDDDLLALLREVAQKAKDTKGDKASVQPHHEQAESSAERLQFARRRSRSLDDVHSALPRQDYVRRVRFIETPQVRPIF